MSSPLAMRENGSTPPIPASATHHDADATNDIPRRLMRVKVLYTFDDQNKSNCLARLPNALSIPTVSLDDNTQVGIIELKTCIQAIVAASPELIHKLGHDFTVYAYDYSEYETPLVGQGMLSWILASASSTPNAPAEQSQTMVTGRVCKNILGLFSNGIKETLEVKLKLVPVPTCLQSEYVENMEKYRNISKIMPEGFDYNAWTDFLKANPTIGQVSQDPASHLALQTLQADYPSPSGGVEPIYDMLARSRPSEDDLRATGVYGAPSPAQSTVSFPGQYQPFQQDVTRPNSRASIRSEAPSRRQSTAPSVAQEQEEDGQPKKKRARITKAKRPPKSALNKNIDSLRVTASTAASVRLHRPTPMNPAMSLNSVEPGQKAPTPRPNRTAMAPFRGPPLAPSALRRGSTDTREGYVSPYPETDMFSDNAIESADEDRGESPGDTPLEMPSSPPIMHPSIPSSAPSSPGLPTLPYPADSGFVSDLGLPRDEEYQDLEKEAEMSDLPTMPLTRRPPNRAKRDWQTVTPGPMDLLPQEVPPLSRPPRPRQVGAEPEGRNGETQTDIAKSLPTTDSQVVSIPQDYPARQPSQSETQERIEDIQQQTDSTTLNTLTENAAPFQTLKRETTPKPANSRRAASKPSRPGGLAKSQTWSGDAAREFFSDSVAMAEGTVPTGSRRPPRSGSGAQRRTKIKENLETALAVGAMPDFCHNCGEIETATWRRAYTRLEHGNPDDVQISQDPTGISGYEVLSKGDGDAPSQYRIFKQKLTHEEEQEKTFTTLTLCNPCGLWFGKKGGMRPREIWSKEPKSKSGASKRKKKPTSEASRKKSKGQDMVLPSDASLPPDSCPAAGVNMNDSGEVPTSHPESRTAHISNAITSSTSNIQRNINSGSTFEDVVAAAALRRAIQSSPPGFLGTKHSPIELEPDLTPKPTRRLLFPSPRKDGQVKSLSDNGPTPSPKTTSPQEQTPDLAALDAELDLPDETDKENCPPLMIYEDDDLSGLFEENGNDITYTTPTKQRQQQNQDFNDLLKTPTPGSRRKALSENPNFTTPSRNGRTPVINAPLTPFTAQLNALLSDTINSSPARNLDLSAFSNLTNTPLRGISFQDFNPDDFLSSDLPMPSSSPHGMFSLYEDPATSTIGLWSGTSIFDGSDPVRHNDEQQHLDGQENGDENDGDVKLDVDFATIIREVQENGTKNLGTEIVATESGIEEGSAAGEKAQQGSDAAVA